MKRTWKNHILLLTALFHLFADVALAGGAVLCIGPNDHAAIEMGIPAQGCEALDEARALGAEAELSPDACTNCTDTPLHAEAELASKRISGDFDAPPALVAPGLPTPPLDVHGIERLVHIRLDISTTIRAHRSTVLLI